MPHRPFGPLQSATDAEDLAIIATLRDDPLVPLRRIAETTGIAERTVARRFQQLKRRGLVRVVGRTLPGFDGTVAWMVRIPTDVAHARKLSQELARHDRTRWVRVTSAHNEVICGLISPNADTDPIIAYLANDPNVHHVGMDRLLQIWTAQGETSPAPPSTLVDDTDRAILHELGRDGRATHSAIAERVGLTARTVTRRVNRLVESGVLFFEADTSHPDALGTVDALVWVQALPGKIFALADKLAGSEEFPFIAAASGTHSLILSYVGPSYAALLKTIDTELAGFATAYDLVPLSPALKRGG